MAGPGASLIVTTYQAGKVVLLRNEPRGGGATLNTHFRQFDEPMGLAPAGGRLAIGGAVDVREFRDAAAAARLDPPGSHDAAFLPRRVNVTGDVRIHEMAWVDVPGRETSELWFVNTAFSCLATRSDEYSFEPRRRPPFIEALRPGDRCHLNGLAVRDGRVRYATALGVSDGPGGWRDRKRDGGVVIDVDAGGFVARGLSMPHSPRRHGGTLWVLNSGAGGLGTVDPDSGE